MPVTDQAILNYIATHPGAGRENIRQAIAPKASNTTLWRALRHLINKKTALRIRQGPGDRLHTRRISRGARLSANTLQPAPRANLQQRVPGRLCAKQDLLSERARPGLAIYRRKHARCTDASRRPRGRHGHGRIKKHTPRRPGRGHGLCRRTIQRAT